MVVDVVVLVITTLSAPEDGDIVECTSWAFTSLACAIVCSTSITALENVNTVAVDKFGSCWAAYALAFRDDGLVGRAIIAISLDEVENCIWWA